MSYRASETRISGTAVAVVAFRAVPPNEKYIRVVLLAQSIQVAARAIQAFVG